MARPVETASAPAPALLRALRRLLRPLVRLLLRSQIPYPYFADLLKTVYVEIADREFALDQKRQTTSRVSLLTGIHRKEVRRLRAEPPPEDATPAVITLGAQLVARWSGVAEYQTPDGRPRPLARVAASGGGASFERLVESVSKDIRPRAVLDEWLRLGVARLDADDRVTLNVDAFVPERGYDEKAFYFGRNLQDHLSAAAHNLSGEGRPFLERSVYYDRLAPESVELLRTLAEQVGMEALQQVNRRALSLQADDQGRPDATRRVNFGIYHFDEDEAGDGSHESGDG